ncbi:nucleotidyltransferase domain-containing protein [Streptomyces sp. NPDC089424]|uniref:nucleotidyltransferase domain-containing protein n=1 Tax=Streptomyces sp. NPDC089424 TaxID=3365917 RepID=UPI003803D523
MPAAQIDTLVLLLRRTLGDRVLGVYLHGSAVLAGLRPHSDLDVLAVVDGPTSHIQRKELVRELLEVSGGAAGRPVELTVVRHDAVSPWRHPPNCEFLYGERLRAEYERGVVPGPPRCPTWRR